MKTITFLNGKGGVGKTTLCANVSKCLDMNIYHRLGRAILVDADPQASLSDWHDSLKGGDPRYPRYEQLIGAPTRQAILTSHRISAESGNDYMLIDTAGKIHDLGGSALSVSDLVIIPLKPSAMDVWATLGSIELVESVMSYNPHLKALFVINQAGHNCGIVPEVFDALKEAAPTIPLAKTIVHARKAFARMINTGETIFHSRDVKGIQEINALTNEILEILK